MTGDIIAHIQAINKEIENKESKAQLCKDILNNLIHPTQELTKKLIALKLSDPKKYAEIAPMIKDFLYGNAANINIIGNFFINEVLHIGEQIDINDRQITQEGVPHTNGVAIITHMKNKLFDAIRMDMLKDKDFVFSLASAINKITNDPEGYKTISAYSTKEVEFNYKNKKVRLSIKNIMQQIGKQKTGMISKFKEGQDALVEQLQILGYNESQQYGQSVTQEEDSKKVSIKNIMPVETNVLPVAIKQNKERLYTFLIELRKELSQKTPNEHFSRLKASNPEIRKMELEVIVEQYIIKNSVHNIYNTLSKIFFNKQGNFAAVHEILVFINKIDIEEFSKKYTLTAESEKDIQDDKKTNEKKEDTQHSYIATTKVQEALSAVIEKRLGTQVINKFIEHYNIREDETAMKRVQDYKIILRTFITEVQKFINDKKIVEEIRQTVKKITDTRLDTPLKAYNYIHTNRYGTITQEIIDIIKKHNNEGK